MVKLRVQPIPSQAAPILHYQDVDYDVFSWYKAQVLYVAALSAAAALAWVFVRGFRGALDRRFYLPLAIWATLLTLSTCLSLSCPTLNETVIPPV